MDIDRGKLSELAKTLTDDQRQLLREGLAGGGDLDPDTLAESLRSFDTQAMFDRLAADSSPADEAPLKFKKGRRDFSRGTADDPVVLRLDHQPADLAEVARLAHERTGRELTSASEVRVMDLDPDEADHDTLTRLASHDLTRRASSARRAIRVENPALTTRFDDLGGLQDDQGGGAVAARRVIVVIIIGPIIIIVVFPPTNPTPPPEPPLTRW